MPTQRIRLITTATLVSVLCLCGARASAETVVHAGDHVDVTVYNHPDLSTSATVTSDGDISLPVAGELHVEGLSSNAIAQRVRDALGRVMISPSVLVRVTAEGRNIFFTGSRVGTIAFEPSEHLVSAIGDFFQETSSGSRASSAAVTAIDLRAVGLERDGHSMGTFNVEELGRTGESGPTLQPGDLVTLIDKPVRVDIIGDVRTPGPVYIYPGESLTEAVEEAGSFSPTTSLSHIVLERAGNERVISSAGAEFTAPAENGDVLTLQAAPHVNVFGMVSTPGEVILKNDTTLLSALYSAGGPTKWADVKHIRIVSHDGDARYVDLAKLVHGDLTANVALNDGDMIFVPEGHRLDATPVIETINAARAFLF